MSVAVSVAVVVLILCFAGIALYNAMIRGRNLSEEAWSGIQVQLRRRHDLIPSLVNVVQGYVSHEQEVFGVVANARVAVVDAEGKSVQAVENAEKGLGLALGRLFAVAEAYPELKADRHFLQLQQALAVVEEEIQMARRYYNGTARSQNNRIMQFPGNIVAGAFGFRKIEYFELGSKAEQAVPEVSFPHK